MDHHGADHERHDGVGRDAEREHRDEARLGARVVGGLGARHAADVALSEGGFCAFARELLLEGVGRKGREKRAAARQDAEEGSEQRSSGDRARRHLEVLLRREHALDLDGHEAARLADLEVLHDLREAVDAHRDRHEVDAVHQLVDAERVAQRARIDVRAHEAEDEAHEDHADGLEKRAVGEHHGAHEAEHHQAEVLGGAELEGELGQGRREGRDQHRGEGARDEAADGRNAERRARAALLGHAVAVDAGDHCGGLARNVDEDGRRGAAVLGAVVDARKHDEGGRRVERVRDRQEHRHGGDGSHAGQHADERAHGDAREAVEKILKRDGVLEAEQQVGDEIHVRTSLRGRPAEPAPEGPRRR